jgi:hypothetical protein
MPQRDWRAFQAAAKQYFEGELGVTLVPEVLIQLDDGQQHHFDFGTQDATILIECKCYTFTATGKEPAAKLNHAKTDAHLLRASHANRKIIAFDDDLHPKKGSLAHLFARRNSSWLGDVEVWRHWQGTFEKISTTRGIQR